MSQDASRNPVGALINKVAARVRESDQRDDPPLPKGFVAFVIEKAWVPGAGEIDSPMVLIRDGERTFLVADGRELAMLAEISPRFARWAVSPRPED